MQALSGLAQQVGVGQKKPKTLVEKVQDMIKELFEELFIYFLKFKAWLTPGTADDQAAEAAAKAEDMGDSLKSKFS